MSRRPELLLCWNYLLLTQNTFFRFLAFLKLFSSIKLKLLFQTLDISIVYEIYDAEQDSPELEYPPVPPPKPNLSSTHHSSSVGSYSSTTSEGKVYSKKADLRMCIYMACGLRRTLAFNILYAPASDGMALLPVLMSDGSLMIDVFLYPWPEMCTEATNVVNFDDSIFLFMTMIYGEKVCGMHAKWIVCFLW